MEQSVDAFQKSRPEITVGQIWQRRENLDTEVTVGMIPSLLHRLERIPPDTFDLVIVDEAHYARSRTWERVIRHFRPKLLVGLSATPNRTDGRSLLTQAHSLRLRPQRTLQVRCVV